MIFASSVMVAGGVVYVSGYPSSGKYGKVFAVSADTGYLLWNSTEPLGFVVSPPAVVDGKVFITDAGPFYNGYGGKLWAYKLNSG